LFEEDEGSPVSSYGTRLHSIFQKIQNLTLKGVDCRVITVRSDDFKAAVCGDQVVVNIRERALRAG